jgi:hypothetical protein
MLEQNELQNPSFVILKDQNNNRELGTILSLTESNPLYLLHIWHLLNQNTMQCNV